MYLYALYYYVIKARPGKKERKHLPLSQRRRKYGLITILRAKWEMNECCYISYFTIIIITNTCNKRCWNSRESYSPSSQYALYVSPLSLPFFTDHPTKLQHNNREKTGAKKMRAVFYYTTTSSYFLLQTWPKPPQKTCREKTNPMVHCIHTNIIRYLTSTWRISTEKYPHHFEFLFDYKKKYIYIVVFIRYIYAYMQKIIIMCLYPPPPTYY